MKVNDASVEFLPWSGRFPDTLYEVFDLVNFFMNAVLVPSFGVEQYLFFNMVAIDEDVFVFVSLRVEQGDPVFQSEIKLKIRPEVYHLGNPVYNDKCFRLHSLVRFDVPS